MDGLCRLEYRGYDSAGVALVGPAGLDVVKEAGKLSGLRELLEATGASTVEMPRSRERGFCCGGGGARAFMEETIGTRIAVERSREAIGTGAQVIATACPFCTTMLSDGVASEGADVRVTDVATLMLEAVRRGGE